MTSSSSNGEDKQCAVCHEVLPAGRHHAVLRCGHEFHADCIVPWFRRGERSCPVCRDEGPSPTSSSSESAALESVETDSMFGSQDDLEEDLDRFRIHSSRSEVSRLVRASLSTARRFPNVRTPLMRRLRVRAARYLKAAAEANEARRRANAFLRAHSGPLLNGMKRYNALVRMWGTRERRLRNAAVDLFLDHHYTHST